MENNKKPSLLVIIGIFFIFSIIGWALEFMNDGRPHYSFKFKTFLGEVPFLPIYGLGGVLVYLLTFTDVAKLSPIFVTLILAFIITLYEYVAGILSGGAWNYNNNLRYIDLKHTIIWSIFSLVLFYIFIYFRNKNYI